MSGEPRELRDVCVAAAEAGGKILRGLFGRPRSIHLKGRIDLVTDADKAAEERVLQVLAERAPGVPVLAEESGERGGGGELLLLVDPLDGTTNYAHGIPIFSCTVAATQGGRVVAGCTVDPLREERFFSSRGGGAYLLSAGVQRRLRVSEAKELSEAVVCTGFPYERHGQLAWMIDAFGRFTDLARGTRRLGSAAIDLAYVAAGRLDGFYEPGLQAWDVAAGSLFVEEAGGVVTRFDGGPLDLFGGEIVASGPALAPVIRAMLAAARGASASSHLG